ncbi:uncharacterized protein LOC131150523 [Malania oleifera]|uniref:uncharacterized protein LOC131150523 n=1 Tax=Malania oleifera TaxID=397392 RepID=UPI0025AE1341|nr:uncharacterized protein LOC131150523 [Malania oleifera]
MAKVMRSSQGQDRPTAKLGDSIEKFTRLKPPTFMGNKITNIDDKYTLLDKRLDKIEQRVTQNDTDSDKESNENDDEESQTQSDDDSAKEEEEEDEEEEGSQQSKGKGIAEDSDTTSDT